MVAARNRKVRIVKCIVSEDLMARHLDLTFWDRLGHFGSNMGRKPPLHGHVKPFSSHFQGRKGGCEVANGPFLAVN